MTIRENQKQHIMKRTLQCLLLLAATVSFHDSHAQNPTPNPGFENWTQVANYWNPNGWNNLNSNTAIIGVFTCTRATGADVHSGTYAIKLTTKSVFGITANGIASTATLITTPPYGVTGGIPYTQRPDSITGWYKYTPASAADSGFVQFVLLGSSNDTIGFVKFNTPNTAVGTYTRFSRPITYFSAATPSLSYWILSSSDGVNPVVNSSIIVDDLALVFNTTGISNPEHFSQVSVVNTWVDGVVMINNPTPSPIRVEIFNSSGQMVTHTMIDSGRNSVATSSLPEGIFMMRFSDSQGRVLNATKIFKY
jgi:hypothetical protein